MDEQIVRQAISLFEVSPERRAGYALDFGVLDTGATALVEFNDGYSLGTYGLKDECYFDLISSRWMEITQSRAISPPDTYYFNNQRK